MRYICKPFLKYQTRLKMLVAKNALAYCAEASLTTGKKIIVLVPRPRRLQPPSWGQCYKTFYGRNLWIFIIS